MTKGEESRGVTPSADVPGQGTIPSNPASVERPLSESGASAGASARASDGGATVAGALQGISFPTNKEDLVERAGARPVEFRQGQFMSLGELLVQIRAERFSSVEEVVDAIHERIREK